MKKDIPYSKSEKTRRFIIETTATLFNTKGYAGTSMFDIATVTGLTKGSVYGNFQNKDELAIEAFKYNVATIGSIFQSELSVADTPFGKLLLLPNTYSKIYIKISQTGGCPILNTASEADDTHPTLKYLAQKAVKNITAIIAQIIEDAISQKEIKADIQPQKTANLIVVLMEGGFLISKLNDDIQYFDNALEHVKKMIDALRI